MLRLRKTFQIVALTAGALFSWTNISSAASVTWDGGGADNNWSTKGNWSGGGGGNPPDGDDTINFAGTTRLSNINNFTYASAAGTNITIDFNSGAGAFTLNGNQMALTASIANNSANLQTFNMAITMAAGSATTNKFSINTASNDITMNGVVSGTNNLVKSGANDLILTAANTYSGGTTLNAGNISMSNNAALGTGAITFASNSSVTALANLNVANAFAIAASVSGTFTVNPTFSQTNTGIISGAGTLVKSGTGTLILANTNNSYSGGTTVNAGTLNMGTNNVLSSGAVTVNGSGAALDIGTFSDTVGAVTLTTGLITGTTGVLTGTSFAMSGDGDASAILGGSGATLTKTGALTTTTLSGANTYTGATTITSGALNIQNSTGLGTVAGGTTVANLAALELQNGISVGAEALTLNGTGVSSGGALRNISGNNTYGGLVTLGLASRINSDSGTLSLTNTGTISGAFGLTVGGAGDTVLNSILGTTTGTLTKDGAGKLTLTGGNTYTGATAISSGVVNVQNSTGLGTTAGGVTVANLAALELQGGISVGAEALTLNGAGVSSAGALRNISGNNTYGGLLTLGSASRINSDSGTLSLTNAATITGNTFGLTVGGAGDTVLNSILGTTSGTLTKDGAGKLTLTGGNTYTGATAISNGVVNVQNSTGLGTTAGGVTVANLAALELQNGISVGAEALTLNGAGVSSGGALRNISGNNTYGGLVTLGSASRINSDSGTLSLTNAATITGNTFGLTVGGAGDTVLNSILGTTSGSLTKDGAGKLTLGAANTFTGLTTVSNGTLAYGVGNALSSGAVTVNGSGAVLNIGTFSDTVGAVTLTSGSITGTTGALTGTSFAMNGTGSASAILGGSGATLTKTGALTTTTLSGANTYTGATTIASGALNIQNSTGLGTTAGGVTVNATGAALELQGNISVGAEALTLNGTGVSEAGALRNISGNNTYGGLVTLGSASRINSDSGTLSLTNAATITGNTFGLTVGGAGDTVLNSILGTTSGSLTKDGAGKLTLGAANTFTGLTTVSGGTLAYGVANALSSGAVTVNGSGAVLDIGTFSDTVGAVTLTSGSITGTTGVLAGSSFAVSGAGSASAILGGSGATLTKTGVGTTTTLSKSNSYTGATTVTSGTLNVATGGSIASSSSTVAAGAAMVVNGTAGAVTLNGSLSGAGTVGALELNNGSSLNPGNSPGLLSASSSKWNAGATYNFQMTSATGTAGANWDLLDVSTLLDLSALSSSAKFNLNIETAGPLSGYDVNTPFAWTFAQSGSLALPSGYAFVSTLVASSIDITSAFNLTFTDASSFAGGVTSGFKIIAYTDPTGVEKIALVPEPSTGSLLLFGFGGLALLRLARRRSVG